ncbi:hypothetical protein PPROV_000651000 [Pycnococcus provasolii]|uniref:Uncharacterized protein n=1 Tax=Pycnococcus provasolii TaxID=41880 RepID=A0A830HLL3_9CHLO|nr:hypothetical protein PPROV_000651000 [Pycnococcus provasolii]
MRENAAYPARVVGHDRAFCKVSGSTATAASREGRALVPPSGKTAATHIGVAAHVLPPVPLLYVWDVLFKGELGGVMSAGDRVRDTEKKVLKERDTSPEDSAAE